MDDFLYVLEAHCANAESIYRTGETVRFFASLKCNDSELHQGKVDWTLFADGNRKHSCGTLDLSVFGASVEYSSEYPGCCRCVFEYTTPGGERLITPAGAAISPEHIKASWQVPDDFDQFWDRQKARLADVPLNPRLKKLKSLPDYECFDLTVDCAGQRPVRGFLMHRKGIKAKSSPALVCFDGAGVRNSIARRILPFVENNFIVLSINAHGIENEQNTQYYSDLWENELAGYPQRGIIDGSLDKVYFTDMFLRARRAIDYICGREEWDGRNLILYGGSQGALQCFAAAYLDSRVSVICTEVPAGSDIAEGGWPLGAKAHEMTPEQLEKTTRCAAYFDNVSFASKLSIPMHTSVGFSDGTCPAYGIYAAFNAYKGKNKEILTCAKRTHTVTNENTEKMIRFIFDAVK